MLVKGAGQFMSALGFYMGMKFMTEGKIGFENLFICLMTGILSFQLNIKFNNSIINGNLVMITAQSVGRSSTFMTNIKKGKLAAINVCLIFYYSYMNFTYYYCRHSSSLIERLQLIPIKMGMFLSKMRNTAMINDYYCRYIPADGEFDPNFSFQNISFTYPARPTQPIFTGEFNITGRKNQTLALVGPSGCGKVFVYYY